MLHMTSSQMKTERSWLRTWLLVGCALGIAYPMSMGPAYWLLNNRVISQPFFNTVYYPLKPITINSRLFQKYLDLWGGSL